MTGYSLSDQRGISRPRCQGALDALGHSADVLRRHGFEMGDGRTRCVLSHEDWQWTVSFWVGDDGRPRARCSECRSLGDSIYIEALLSGNRRAR